MTENILSRPLVLYAISFIIFCILIFAAPGFIDHDDYYHARMATLIAEQGRLALDFHWLPMTNLDPFVDHHLLFHIFLVPFAVLGGVTAVKLAVAGIAAGIVVAAFFLLRTIGVQYPVLWAAGIFGLSIPFLMRMVMIRTQGASVLMLVVALALLFQKRYRWLVPLAFAYTWLYNGFVLMGAFTGAYAVAVLLAERKIEWRPVVYCGIGLALGLIINPYFPHNLQFILEHLGAKVDFASGVPVGSEWYPYNLPELLIGSPGAFICLALGIYGIVSQGQRRDRVGYTLLFAALITLFMLTRSRRFIEYFPPFALLLCAATWGRLPFDARTRRFIPLRLVAVIVIFAAMTLPLVREAIRRSRDYETFAGASEWLKNNTPENTLVFQTAWDDFPHLFYYNTHNVYLTGLDPTYLQLGDPERWAVWTELVEGRVANPSEVIRSTFGTNYVVSDREHEDFQRQAEADPSMKVVYEDQYSLVWEIEDGTGDS